ncbi:MAG TPA: MGMT family protein [Ktedonobacterales bacterium]|nr:MGMT family protein [Ktedonobacterales bacterium]
MPDPQPQIAHEEARTLARSVYALVCACPAGRVTTYGWIGAALGYPRGARMIGWFMNETPDRLNVPAQRVINAKGELTGSWAFGQRGRMRALLEAEGVVFDENGRVDMKRYGWDPSRDLSAEERERILAAAASDPIDVSDHLIHLLLDDPASPYRSGSSPSERPAAKGPENQQSSLWG